MMLTPQVEALIDAAIAEDMAYGDLTSEPLFKPIQIARAHMVCRQPAVISGLPVASRVFEKIDSAIACELKAQNGDTVTAGTVLMALHGPVISLLKGERLALNFLQHLSGIATLTFQYAGAIAGTKAKVVHTRKTIPGLRALAIQAVLDGGGSRHRQSLSQAVLLKDNHIQACGSISKAVQQIRQVVGHMVKVEVECDTLAQVQEAADAGVDAILLDNMTTQQLSEAVKLVNGRAILEASGGVTLSSILAIAQTGVDVISTSQITMSAPAVDIGLDFVPD